MTKNNTTNPNNTNRLLRHYRSGNEMHFFYTSRGPDAEKRVRGFEGKSQRREGKFQHAGTSTTGRKYSGTTMQTVTILSNDDDRLVT